MTDVEKRVTFGQINSVESDVMVPIGTILRKLGKEEQETYAPFEGHQWFEVLNSPAGKIPEVTADGWIPIATGLVCLISDEEIATKTVIAQE